MTNAPRREPRGQGRMRDAEEMPVSSRSVAGRTIRNDRSRDAKDQPRRSGLVSHARGVVVAVIASVPPVGDRSSETVEELGAPFTAPSLATTRRGVNTGSLQPSRTPGGSSLVRSDGVRPQVPGRIPIPLTRFVPTHRHHPPRPAVRGPRSLPAPAASSGSRSCAGRPRRSRAASAPAARSWRWWRRSRPRTPTPSRRSRSPAR